MIIRGARRLPLPGARPPHFAAHHVAVHPADVEAVADGETDLLALEAALRDRLLVEGARKHLEVLLEAQRALRHAPDAGDLRGRVVEMRRAPVAAIAGGGLGGIRGPLRDGEA